jgi:hypothetical protein
MKDGKMVKIIGYILLLLSCSIWGLIFIIPWFDFSKNQIAVITTILIIAGEILFYVSMIILGKSFFDKIKHKLKFWRTKRKDTYLL